MSGLEIYCIIAWRSSLQDSTSAGIYALAASCTSSLSLALVLLAREAKMAGDYYIKSALAMSLNLNLLSLLFSWLQLAPCHLATCVRSASVQPCRCLYR